MLEFIQESRKAILGFVGIVVGLLVENLVTSDGNVVLPQAASEWVTLLGTAVVGAIAIYVVPNARNRKQVDKDVEKLNTADKEDVVTAALHRLPEESTDRVITKVRPPATND